jgi:ribosomal protein S18 acetylase RimI-like enzyme
MLPDCCGKGLGKRLLNNALVQLRLQGFDSCYLWVLAGNANARRFYEKHGFVWTGEKDAVEIMGEKLAGLRYVYRVT